MENNLVAGLVEKLQVYPPAKGRGRPRTDGEIASEAAIVALLEAMDHVGPRAFVDSRGIHPQNVPTLVAWASKYGDLVGEQPQKTRRLSSAPPQKKGPTTRPYSAKKLSSAPPAAKASGHVDVNEARTSFAKLAAFLSQNGYHPQVGALNTILQCLPVLGGQR